MMTEEQRAAMQAAHDALAIAQNNLAGSRESAVAFDDGDLWDKYQRAMDGITSALAEPDLDPSCDDKRLAEMIMSDCGHSTNHTRLLERITNRIATHVATRTEESAADEREACAVLMSSMRAKSRNHLFRSALTCAEGETRARGES